MPAGESTGWFPTLEIDPPGLGEGGERTRRDGGDSSMGSMGVVLGWKLRMLKAPGVKGCGLCMDS